MMRGGGIMNGGGQRGGLRRAGDLVDDIEFGKAFDHTVMTRLFKYLKWLCADHRVSINQEGRGPGKAKLDGLCHVCLHGRCEFTVVQASSEFIAVYPNLHSEIGEQFSRIRLTAPRFLLGK